MTYGQESIDTRATPTMMAAFTRNAMRNAVKRPPHMMPSHILELVMRCPVQAPVFGSRYAASQPAMVSGVDGFPVIMPIPSEYDMPTMVRNRPMPTPLAVFIVAGMIFTSQWRIPVNARRMNMKPSTKTAVRASEYGTEPVPRIPTTWYAK